MPQDHHSFQTAKIVDKKTVRAPVDGTEKILEILDGGLPEGTTHVTVRTNKQDPNGRIILGAHIKGRVSPVTVLGSVVEK